MNYRSNSFYSFSFVIICTELLPPDLVWFEKNYQCPIFSGVSLSSSTSVTRGSDVITVKGVISRNSSGKVLMASDSLHVLKCSRSLTSRGFSSPGLFNLYKSDPRSPEPLGGVLERSLYVSRTYSSFRGRSAVIVSVNSKNL